MLYRDNFRLYDKPPHEMTADLLVLALPLLPIYICSSVYHNHRLRKICNEESWRKGRSVRAEQ